MGKESTDVVSRPVSERLDEFLPREPERVEPTIEQTKTRDQQVKTWLRKGVFAWGNAYLFLGVVDAMWDPFPASELFFGGTGAALAMLALSGRLPKLWSGKDA